MTNNMPYRENIRENIEVPKYTHAAGFTLIAGGAGSIVSEALIKVALPGVDLRGFLYAVGLVCLAWGARYISQDRKRELILEQYNETRRPVVEAVDDVTYRSQYQGSVSGHETLES